ncbi:flagellin [Waltera sp.]|jgi:flagellin|uniref:flagellin N-terminal helical domain-containing protein n=1 Tax=Waltera sp. TaxID=2815806 RepID=UPI003AB60171
MVVQHNLTAMNSNRMLGLTTASQAKSTEKLSSGYKINRAADDAAGLSISEKMRKQIRGLTQASLNAQDGISAVQTAEGALTEVHDMLQRMNELAVKASNGTMSKDDREYVQNEVDQLVTEIDRVAETTKFNETYLLKGDDTKAAVTENVFKKFDVSTLNSVISDTSKISESNDFDSMTGKFTLKFTSGLAEGGTWGGKRIVADSAQTTTGEEIKLADAKTAELKALNDAITATNQVTGKATNDGAAFQMTSAATMKQSYTYAAAIDVSLHVGADSTANNRINLSIDSMSASGLHVTGLKVNGSDATNATAAINTIADAIQKVSTQRSALGAVQNRLEHTINNLDNVVENTTSAESQIRDTDMATEMVKYSNNNILAQAGQAMLAQSNQANQGVLSLLQ